MIWFYDTNVKCKYLKTKKNIYKDFLYICHIAIRINKAKVVYKNIIITLKYVQY